ncbi:scd2/ral3 [Purpureocillium lilacinum]|uniref:Scd2/ral3 n=1 Tax=Purpureocillium lilacinum TaxID=33203 RepID=A0A179HEI6_PURLI|nr:scd2/ral3 [Purpureocillium lilacinum]OAQ87991.1 scd2/ral3 [Purpureocillium lilacinum]OAQ90046.1 scd2/ral3 [Purpureocillium lilacinum]GJN69707.1 bud emergence protein 1 [Purpureocillium lilacinum]GJN76610.1 bud emergence protein 1 [Purpureocillium lilacinum]
MDLVKALRRSMKGEKHKPNSPSIGSKSALAIVPPKKVIRANDDYQPDDALVQSFAKAGVQILSFSKGDFFHVIGREDDANWYEACNPALPDARGLVPVGYFQVLGRTERDSGHSDGKNQDHDSGYGEAAVHPAGANRASKPAKSGGIVSAKVKYYFEAAKGRPDELTANEDEDLIIIAQSNKEWVVAKPIRRLGGPGLIPIGFIDIFDDDSYRTNPPTPVADPLEALRKANVPTVEEWKRMAAQYKNSSITLGKFDGSRGPQNQQQQPQQQQQAGLEQNMARMSLQQQQQINQNGSQAMYANAGAGGQQPVQEYAAHENAAQLYAPVWARIPRYCFAEEKYWFVIEAELEDGRSWELSRYYQDFYDFQIALLAEFPAEAGNTGTQKRSLPYMPGPVSYVTDAITEGRLYNLDAYVKNLLNQPPHISRCDLVKLFFAPREGDYEIDSNANGDEEYRLSQGSRQSSADSPANAASRQGSRNNLNGYNYGGLSATPRQGTSQQDGAQKQAAPMKIKVRFKDDVFAMRVSTDIQFQELADRIRDRVKATAAEQVQLSFQDEPSGTRQNLANNGDLDYALQRNEKLTLFVEVS